MKKEDNREKINSKIKEIGLKKYKVAQSLGITDVWLSNYLTGKGNLSAEKENKLLKMLGF